MMLGESQVVQVLGGGGGEEAESRGREETFLHLSWQILNKNIRGKKFLLTSVKI